MCVCDLWACASRVLLNFNPSLQSKTCMPRSTFWIDEWSSVSLKVKCPEGANAACLSTPVENFRDVCEIHSLAGVQNRSCSRPIWSCGEPLVPVRPTRGTELRRDESVRRVSLVDRASFTARRVCSPSQELPSGVSTAPWGLPSKSPPVGRSARDKVATTTFLLIPEQLSLAKDFIFPPTITEVSLSNDFYPSVKWLQIGSDWGSGAQRGLLLTFPPLGGALRHSPSLAVSIRPPLHLVGPLRNLPWHLPAEPRLLSAALRVRQRRPSRAGFFFFSLHARNGAGRAPPRSACTTDRY